MFLGGGEGIGSAAQCGHPPPPPPVYSNAVAGMERQTLQWDNRSNTERISEGSREREREKKWEICEEVEGSRIVQVTTTCDKAARHTRWPILRAMTPSGTLFAEGYPDWAEKITAARCSWDAPNPYADDAEWIMPVQKEAKFITRLLQCYYVTGVLCYHRMYFKTYVLSKDEHISSRVQRSLIFHHLHKDGHNVASKTHRAPAHKNRPFMRRESQKPTAFMHI